MVCANSQNELQNVRLRLFTKVKFILVAILPTTFARGNPIH